MNSISILVIAGCMVAASAGTLRAAASQMAMQQAPVMGYPSGGVPILPENLDFAAGLQTSDFVFDVLGETPNTGSGGTIQARNSVDTPALQGQGISLSLFTVNEGGQNLIHYHPRATELLYVIQGKLEVGFVDTSGNVHVNVANAGQATVFPHGLLHFQRNIGTGTAQYISMLNSENPGVMSFPRSIAAIPDPALGQAFRTSQDYIDQFKGKVLPPQLFQGGVNPNYDGAAGPQGNAPVPAFGTSPTTMPPADDQTELFQKLLEYLQQHQNQ